MSNATDVKLQLSKVFGHQCSVRDSLTLCDRNVLFYLSGRLGVFHNLEKAKSQKFVDICEEKRITSVAFGLNNVLAIAVEGKSPTVSIFNLKTQEKKILPKPEEISSKEYVAMSFSADNGLLGGQGGAPDWAFVLWKWDKKRIETVFYPFRMQTEAEVYKFAFCPEDPRSVVVVGNQFLRFFHLKEDMKVQETPVHQAERSHLAYHSVTWLADGKSDVAVGSSDGSILVFKETQFVRKVSLADQMSHGNEEDDKSVNVLLSYAEGMLCSYGSTGVLMLASDFTIIKTLKIPGSSVGSYVIQLTFNKEHIAAATKDGRILSYSFAEHFQDNLSHTEMHVLQDFQHTKTVLCADATKHLPLLVTCSSSVLLLRDVGTESVLIRCGVDSAPRSISLHPMGTSVAISFEKKVKLFNILRDTLVEEKSFETNSGRSQVAFAPSGHLMALTNEIHINLFYTIGFKKLTTFSAHHSEVQMIAWRNDNFLVSSDADGTLHEWDVLQKKEFLCIEIPNVYHTSLALPGSYLAAGKQLYVASSDRKIRLIKDGSLIEDTALSPCKVTALAAFESTLIAGTEKGTILVFSPSLRGPYYENQCHAAEILHISEWGSTVIVTGADGIISSWNFKGAKNEKSTKTLDEVLTEITDQEAFNNRIDELESELRLQVQRTNKSRSQQSNEFQSELSEVTNKSENIQSSLQTVVDRLKKEIEEIRKNNEISIYNREFIIRKEMKENDEDFNDKLLKEETFMQQAVNKRTASEKELKKKIEETIQEKHTCLDAFEDRYSRHMEKIRELETMIEQEQVSRKEIEKERKDLSSKRLEDIETNSYKHQPSPEEKEAQEQDAAWSNPEIEAKNLLLEEKERGRTLDEEFKRKQETYRLLQEKANQITQKVEQVKADVSRMDKVISVKGNMKQKLEKDVTELSVESDDHLQEYEKDQKARAQELVTLKSDLQKRKDTHQVRTIQLQRVRREEVVLNERLMSTENSVKENAKELFAAELLLERCRQEFATLTTECHTKASLRRVLLNLYDKRVLKTRTKDDAISNEDINPYTNFYRQRDHYESLINNVRSRTSQIKETFRGNYVKLAKENSDWTSFAESLRFDIRQHQTRIETLEEALGMKSDQFRLDPDETRRRLEEVAEILSVKEDEEKREIERRLALSEDQEKEIRRLHGLLTVGEKGRKIRRMPR